MPSAHPPIWDVDDELAARAVSGDYAAVSEAIRRLAPYLLQLVLARLSNARGHYHAAEDIAQDILLSLHKNITRIRIPTALGLRAYVGRMAKNRVATYLAQKRQGLPVAEDRRRAEASWSGLGGSTSLLGRMASDQTGPATAAFKADLLGKVLDVLGDLDPVDREIVILVLLEGVPAAEIAARIGITRNAASMRLLRVMRKVADQLGVRTEDGKDA